MLSAKSLSQLSVVSALLLLGLASPAYAYVGPGAGITAIGSLIALVAAVLLAVVGFIWYPLKAVLGRRKQAEDAIELNEDGTPKDPS